MLEVAGLQLFFSVCFPYSPITNRIHRTKVLVHIVPYADLFSLIPMSHLRLMKIKTFIKIYGGWRGYGFEGNTKIWGAAKSVRTTNKDISIIT